MEKIKKSMRALLDVIFEVLYIAVMILAILDIFGLLVFVQSDGWMKILVLIFATVGLVTISDKKRLEENIEPELTRISDVQNSEIGSVKKIEDNTNVTLEKLDDTKQIKYFKDKTQFYLYLTQILLKMPSGVKIDVTSFEKNYNISYEIGENRHIESFMKTWNERVQNGQFVVRQLVHITSEQDYCELCERIGKFKSNYNFTVSAMVGLPIAPFMDYMIVNQEYVFIGFSDDMSSPCNFSWGMVVKGKEIAQRLQSHFNIYWSSQFSLLIKDKDEVKQRNLKKVERYVYDIDHNMNLIKYQGLTLEICHVNEKNRSVVPLLENLNGFYRNCCCDILQSEIERKIDEISEFVKKRTQEYIRFDRDKATELIAKMMMDSKKKICAVSLDIDDNDFWINSEGEEVFRANIDAIKKQKVMIERVFVCTKATREILKEAIDEQCKAGIGVTYTEYKKGMGGTYEDFMIVDNQALLIFEKNCVRVSMNRAHIEQYNKKYLKIKNMGTVL